MMPDVFFQIAAVGVLATYAHLIMALWAPSYGLPRIDFSMGIADISWGESFGGKPPYWMGFTAIHLNGIIFAFVYATEMAPILPGPALIKGLIWGGILFVGAPVHLRSVLFEGRLFRPQAWPLGLGDGTRGAWRLRLNSGLAVPGSLKRAAV